MHSHSAKRYSFSMCLNSTELQQKLHVPKDKPTCELLLEGNALMLQSQLSVKMPFT